jgi:YggT family protein
MSIVVLVLNWISYAIVTAAFVMVAALLLRMALQWAQVNPFGWFALNLRRLTEPVMRPFRYGLDGRTMRFDMMPLVAAALVLINGLFAAWIVGQFASVADDFAKYRITLGLVLADIVWIAVVLYLAALFARFLLPMLGFGYSNPFLRVAYQLTEPVLKPLRRYLIFGAFDFSPLILIFVLQFVGGMLRLWLKQL